MIFNSSRRVLNFMQSEIRNMSIECEQAGGINLSQGICDLPLPQILKAGINEAVELGYNSYTRYDGLQYLRKQIAEKANKYNKIICSPDKNIIVSCGATGALYCACYALFNQGDEVILFEPFYGYHEYTLLSLDLQPLYLRLETGNWNIDFDKLENLISKKTKAILIINPVNPCGKVFSRDELKKIGELCRKYNLILLSDEIYEYIIFDERKHVSPASIPELSEYTITVSGFSKTFSITGWRVGYAIVPEKVVSVLGYVNDLLYVCSPSMAQYAIAKTIENITDEYYFNISMEYQRKRDLLCTALEECNMKPYVPQGAYYVLADAEVLHGDTSGEKARYFLEKTGIGTVPGDAFYKNGFDRNLLRFCFAKDLSTIERVCSILEESKNKWL